MVTDRTAAFARAWAAAAAPPPGRGPDPAAAVALLVRLTDRLGEALLAEPFHPSAGHEIGAALVGAGLTAPEVIGRTAEHLTGLPAALDADVDEVRDRVPALIGAVITGHAAARQACEREEQDAARRAAADRHREADRAIRSAEGTVRAVLTAVDAPVAVCTPDGRIVEAGPLLADLLRMRPEDLRGRCLIDLAAGEHAATLTAILRDELVRDPRRRVRASVALRRDGGALVYLALTLSLVPGRAPDPGHVVVVGGDVHLGSEAPPAVVGPPVPIDLTALERRVLQLDGPA